MRPVVLATGLPAPDRAVSLLIKIAAWESRGVTFLDQIDRRHRDGPAYGPFQFEKGGGFAEVHRLMRKGAGYTRLDTARAVWPKYRVSDIRQLRMRLDSAVFYARVLLYPHRLVLPTASAWKASYLYYEDQWRPGKPPTIEEFRNAYDEWRAAS